MLRTYAEGDVLPVQVVGWASLNEENRRTGPHPHRPRAGKIDLVVFVVEERRRRRRVRVTATVTLRRRRAGAVVAAITNRPPFPVANDVSAFDDRRRNNVVKRCSFVA